MGGDESNSALADTSRDGSQGNGGEPLIRADAKKAVARKRVGEAKSLYGRGKEVSVNRVKDRKLRANLSALERRNREAILKARDAEILHENEAGFLAAEDDLEKTYRARQEDIQLDLDLQTAKKRFELKLSDGLGPYKVEYTRNGKDLLLAGEKGHLATVDWRGGNLGCELFLNETIRDAKWLHNNQSFAVAQKKYVYIYDRDGVELHKLHKHIEVTHMEFLPYHFLLASIGTSGYLKYTDTSTGQMIIEIPTKQGAASSFCQDPSTGIVHVGHNNGTISLWSPNATEAHVKLLAHRGPVKSISVDREGRYMVSTNQGATNKMSVWDLRMQKEVNAYNIQRPGVSTAISERGLTAVGWGTQVSIWKGLFDKARDDQEKIQRPYMSWAGEGAVVERVRWCPLEDVLGISHTDGVSSIIVPGAGEPNFDALEINPYENKKQRQESEVRALLNKIQPEMIALNPNFIGQLDGEAKASKQSKAKDQQPQDATSALKNHARGKDTSLKRYLRKKGSKNIIDERRLRIQAMMTERKNREKAAFEKDKQDFGPALSRFAKKER